MNLPYAGHPAYNPPVPLENDLAMQRFLDLMADGRWRTHGDVVRALKLRSEMARFLITRAKKAGRLVCEPALDGILTYRAKAK